MSTPVIGVTGTIGTGKSTLAEFLAQEGGEHLDADVIAKDLMKPGHEGYEPVIEEFGTDITDESGYIRPDVLAEEVFADPEKLERLEAIIHPIVVDKISRRVSKPQKSFYIIDAPLLFEAGLESLCDWVVVVTAPEAKVKERLFKVGFSERQIELRRRSQMSEEEKKERADEVIDNSASIERLRQKAQKLYRRIEKRDFT